MKFTAVGDILVQKRMPENYEGFEEIKTGLNLNKKNTQQEAIKTE